MSSTDPVQITNRHLASSIDHTLLRADATAQEIKKLCEEAKRFQFATVCVNSVWIPLASECLSGSGVKPITVVGFPLGASLTEAKVFEAQKAIACGAQEIDMVISVGGLKAGDDQAVLKDIQAVVEASKPYGVKVIIETALLNESEKIRACELAKQAGASFVKTSTGFAKSGATVEDVRLMRRVVGPSVGVKASGGIKTLQDALSMLEAGANRLGTSCSVALCEQ